MTMELICDTKARDIKVIKVRNKKIYRVWFGNEFMLELDKAQSNAIQKGLTERLK